ncbi:Vacuolar protein sorting-associated protein 8 -like protein [Toxocara canis]|uniref:Vacuolar protein sorting-associated protein 8-like protein n=1 Tax=Toxocara canis TaxID=6265 RepID=A0A0B2V096_TOXCA|nr:Vacuolar protein sorting-associated protein 8 -like protein [Toxocara canis]
MSSITTDEDIVDRWIEIDDTISVPEQTLDEILAEKLMNFDEDLSGVEDDDSSLITGPHSARPVSPVSYTLDSPIKLVHLEAISHQLKSQLEHRYGGPSSAVAASCKHIAVGTSRGLVLIFSRTSQRLERSIFADGSPVSCLDFNFDGAKLAVGYATGLVRVMSVVTGRMIEDTNEVVQPGRGVIQITFMGSGRRLMIVDSGGSVYEMRLHTRVRSRRVKCIFSGCHGEVVYVKTLANDSFLALVSLTKLFLISLPDAQLIFANSFAGPADRPPLIDWQFIDFKLMTAVKSRSAALCAGRGSRIDLYRLIGKTVGAKNVVIVKSFSLDFEMINLKWVDPFHLLALDSEEKIHLIDISKGEIAERDLSTIELVYGSADFKGLSTGGNVSLAMEYLSNAVCYQSMYRVGGEVCILGRSSVCIISVADQIAQLESFIERDDILSAVLYAMDIFTAKVVNKSNRTDLRQIVSGYLPALIDRLLSLTTAGLENGKVTHLVEHYRKHINLLLRTCVTTSRFDLLYNTIYPRLEKDPLSRTIFFEFLDEVVLDGLLDNPPPSLVSDYLQNLVAEGNFNQFEAAVVRIPIDKQDIHYVMTTCRANRLYDGIIYVCNKALEDYLSPLEEMFENVSAFVDHEVLSDCEVAQGNKLLLYLQCCLAGRAYPFGSLSNDLRSVYFILSSIFRLLNTNRLYDGIIYVCNKALEDYLSPLEEMFENVSAFVDHEVLSDCEVAQGNKLLLYLQCCLAGRAYPFGSLSNDLVSTLPLQVYRCLVSLKGKDGAAAQVTYPYLRLLLKLDAQQFFNVICTCSDLPLFTASEGRLQRLVEVAHQIAMSVPANVALLSHLLVFITHLLQKGALMPTLDMISELIEKVLSGDASELRIADTDRCIVELLRNLSGLDETSILRRAERVPHLQVCAYIYTNRREFDRLVECYLRDSVNAQNVFSVVRNIFGELMHEELSSFTNFVRSLLMRLAAVEVYQTAELILDHFIDWLHDAPTDSDLSPLLFYSCFTVRRERGHRTLTGDEDLDERLFAVTVEELVSDEHDDSRDEKLVERLRYWLPIGSRSDRCLNLAVSHNLLASTVMLLEARNLPDRAFEVLFSELEKCWQKDDELVSRYIDEIIRISNVHQVQSRDGKWLLQVLHKILTLPEDALKENTEMKLRLNDIITGIVEGGSGGAELLIDSLFAHPVFRHATYGRFRPLIMSIISSCRYERVMMQTTVRCIEDESTQGFLEFLKRSTSLVTNLILSNLCIVCTKPPHKSSLLFRCGHLMHLECESEHTERQCPCQSPSFRLLGEDPAQNLITTEVCHRWKPQMKNIFEEESMRLTLGPSTSRMHSAESSPLLLRSNNIRDV